MLEICEHYGLVPWRLTPRQVDQYFAGPGKRGRSTVRQKMNIIDSYFAFLEQRYAGEIARRYGVAVESPIDAFNRPRHRGDFGCGCRRRSGRPASSSAAGGIRSARPASR